MKLNRILKELSETKNLLLEKYAENEQLREMNDRLRQLNATLSKRVKSLEVVLDKTEKNNKMLKDAVKPKD